MRTKRKKIKRSEFNEKNRKFKIEPRATQKEIVSRIKELAELLCAAEGIDLVHVESQRGSAGMIIRLYIDMPGGVTLDDCVHISRQMNKYMDVDLKKSDFEPQKRAHSTQLAAGLASESENSKLSYGRCEALPSGRTFPAAYYRELQNIGPYNLEVSSPGPNRPLGKRADFERFKGQIAEIKTLKSVEGKKKFKGVLLGISEEAVEILSSDKTIAIPFKEIARARLINYNGENRCL
ncbi:MAG: ribosome maturation factor RimP [Desulfobacterales bacterium]|nr:ribosome maturation factor RimP [Desulfobacterales bacterium]